MNVKVMMKLKKIVKIQIVAEKTILELFEICRHEGCGAQVLDDDIQVVYHVRYMQVIQHCVSFKNEDFVWETNKLVKGKLSETSLDLIIESQCNGLGTSQMV